MRMCWPVFAFSALRPGERGLRAVEQHVGRVLVDRLLHVEGLMALLAILADGVEVALHHVELVIHRRQAFGRLDEDQAVHAVGDVHADRRGGAVIDVQALVQRLERELRLVARRREARGRAAAGSGDAVQVDVVRHLAARVILEMELDRVALAHADEAAGHGAAESPERVRHAVGDLLVDFDHFEFDDDLGRLLAIGGRRHLRRTGEHRVHRLALRRTEVALHRAASGANRVSSGRVFGFAARGEQRRRQQHRDRILRHDHILAGSLFVRRYVSASRRAAL